MERLIRILITFKRAFRMLVNEISIRYDGDGRLVFSIQYFDISEHALG